MGARSDRESRLWRAVAGASAIAAAVAVRGAARAGWRRVRGQDPPDNPADPEVEWRDAVAWSLGVGLAAGLARLLARRGAAAGWKRLRGRNPAAG